MLFTNPCVNAFGLRPRRWRGEPAGLVPGSGSGLAASDRPVLGSVERSAWLTACLPATQAPSRHRSARRFGNGPDAILR